MKTHELKCWPEFWVSIADGHKNFEVRKGEDRQYEVGDWLMLKEYDPSSGEFTGRQTMRRVGYVLHGGQWLPQDVWVLGFAE